MVNIRSRLPTMSPQSDIISFLSSFERCLEINGTPRHLWIQYLPSVLNERAGRIFSQQKIEVCRDYGQMRVILLNSFKSTPDSYLAKLQGATRQGNESYALFVLRLRELQTHYVESKQIDYLSKLLEDNLLNVFMNSLRPVIKDYVREKLPKLGTVEQASELADLYYSIYGNSKSCEKVNWIGKKTIQRRLESRST